MAKHHVDRNPKKKPIRNPKARTGKTVTGNWYRQKCEETRTLFSETKFSDLFGTQSFRDVLWKAKRWVSGAQLQAVLVLIEALDEDDPDKTLTIKHLYVNDLVYLETNYPNVMQASRDARDQFILPYIEPDIDRTAIADFFLNDNFPGVLGKYDVLNFYKKKRKTLSDPELYLLDRAKALWILRLSPRYISIKSTEKGKCARQNAEGWYCSSLGATETDECSLSNGNPREPLAGCDFC